MTEARLPPRPSSLDVLDTISWQHQEPRRHIQIGVFDRTAAQLCGCMGLRWTQEDDRCAGLGIELTPDNWGRYRLAVEVVSTFIEYGFEVLGLHAIVGSTASGKRSVERLARFFGAAIAARRDGPNWMSVRGWSEVDWALTREAWIRSNCR